MPWRDAFALALFGFCTVPSNAFKLLSRELSQLRRRGGRRGDG